MAFAALIALVRWSSSGVIDFSTYGERAGGRLSTGKPDGGGRILGALRVFAAPVAHIACVAESRRGVVCAPLFPGVLRFVDLGRVLGAYVFGEQKGIVDGGAVKFCSKVGVTRVEQVFMYFSQCFQHR